MCVCQSLKHTTQREREGMVFPETPARKLLRGAGAGASLGFDIDGVGRFFSDLWDLIKAKVNELAAFLAGLLSALAKKADELFPPDTRSETLQRWLHIAVTVVLPPALGTLSLLCLARCCWRYCCCCCAGAARGRGGRGGRGGRAMMVDRDPGFMASAMMVARDPGFMASAMMVDPDPGFMASAMLVARDPGLMVAPGRGGASTPRGVFEDNPRGYFRSLWAKKPLVY